jgi:hypothetical protein
MKYTEGMEKAIQKSHNICFAEYAGKLSNKLKVEKKRERDYQRSKQLAADLDSNLSR